MEKRYRLVEPAELASITPQERGSQGASRAYDAQRKQMYRYDATEYTNNVSANGYFADNASGFLVLLRLCDAQSGRYFHPFHQIWIGLIRAERWT